MEFSDRFILEMTKPFYTDQSTSSGLSLESNLTLDSNNVFNKFLIVDVTGDDIEIPSIARVYYEGVIQKNLTYGDVQGVEKTILPLYTNCDDQSKRTFNCIMREFFCRVSFQQRLLKITTDKGETYYGGRGLILDEGFNPLLMCGLKARKTAKKNGRGKEIAFMQYYRAICRVNPIVFVESDKLINKGIIKKLIPLYATIGTSFPSSNHYFLTSPGRRKVEVIVDDFSKFFITPIAPTPNECSNDAFNKCLNDNIEDILYLI